MFRHHSRCILLTLLVLGAARPLMAQTPVFEISGGYQYVYETAESEFIHYKNGLFAGAAWHVAGPFALAGEFSQSANTQPVGESARYGPIDRTVYTTMGGVRLGGGTFIQALIGQLALRTDRTMLEGRLLTTETEMAWQVGGGWTFGITSRVRALVHADYRQLFGEETSFGRQIRAGVGVAVGFGGR